MTRMASGLLTLTLLLGGAVQAKADFAGAVYQTSFANASNATVANALSLTPSATFTTPTINYNLTSAVPVGGTVNQFLTSNGSTVNGLTPGSVGAQSVQNTLFLFQGLINLVNGQTYSLTHDDGAQLIINGVTVVNSPTPTSPITNTFTATAATSGVRFFQLAYGEVSGLPAVLRFLDSGGNPVMMAVPEPGTLTMAGIGLIAFAGLKLRRRKPAVA